MDTTTATLLASRREYFSWAPGSLDRGGGVRSHRKSACRQAQAGDADTRELTERSAGELARLIAEGTVSARAVLEAHIARIEVVDERLNAVVARRFDAARAEADAVDAARARGETLGPLAGVPITVKEQFHVKGMATTFGLPTRRDDAAEQAEGPLVKRLREAGAIVLGKTNVPQLMLMHETDNPLYGRTNNPWDLDRARRLQRRRGRHHRGRRLAAWARQRPGWQHPPACPRLRHPRPEAHDAAVPVYHARGQHVGLQRGWTPSASSPPARSPGMWRI